MRLRGRLSVAEIGLGLLLLIGRTQLAGAAPRVTASVRQLSSGGFLYQYRVFNDGALDVTGLTIGTDYSDRNWEATLPVRPSGVASPDGWRAEVSRTEEKRLWD